MSIAISSALAVTHGNKYERRYGFIYELLTCFSRTDGDFNGAQNQERYIRHLCIALGIYGSWYRSYHFHESGIYRWRTCKLRDLRVKSQANSQKQFWESNIPAWSLTWCRRTNFARLCVCLSWPQRGLLHSNRIGLLTQNHHRYPFKNW